MTDAQAHALIDRMLAVWPNPMWKPETISEMHTALLELDYPVALTAIERLMRTKKTRPSIAHVHDEVVIVAADVARARRESDARLAAERAKRQPMPSRERVREIVEGAKAKAGCG